MRGLATRLALINAALAPRLATQALFEAREAGEEHFAEVLLDQWPEAASPSVCREALGHLTTDQLLQIVDYVYVVNLRTLTVDQLLALAHGADLLDALALEQA